MSPPGKLPRLSSDRLIRALVRLGFERSPSSGGSHLTLTRRNADGSVDVTVVVQGKREVPLGTLTSILRLARVSREELAQALRKGSR